MVKNFHGVKSQIAERLRELRHGKGLTMDEVAKGTGLSFSHISKLETGGGNPGFGALAILANFYNVPKEYLTNEDDTKKQPKPETTGTVPKTKHDCDALIDKVSAIIADGSVVTRAKTIAEASGCSLEEAVAFILRQYLRG